MKFFFLTHVQAAQAGTINGKRLFKIRAVSFYRKTDKNEVEHITHEVERDAEMFVPYRIEAIISHWNRSI